MELNGQLYGFMLPSCAIGNFLFPTYEVVIMNLSYSSAFNVGKNKM